MKSFEINYSFIDRAVHELALNQLETQKILSKIEDKSFNKKHGEISAVNPVFITSLPRAGTTLLLEIIVKSSIFVSHTYRELPFLMCPIYWENLSKHFRKRADMRERIHSDGMLVSYDSVEAFEEILWLAFWPNHFKSTCIQPWLPEENDDEGEFASFFRQHMRKMIALKKQRSESDLVQRYVSKNNANIGRLGWLKKNFTDAVILIPYRNPADHITSLLHQHFKFLKLHTENPFSLRYMKSIGHFDFGKALRPINLEGWNENFSELDPTTPDFWAEYWIATYNSVLQAASTQIVVFSYDRLCATPKAGLEMLEHKICVANNSLVSLAPQIHAPTSYSEKIKITPQRAKRIQDILDRLDALSFF